MNHDLPRTPIAARLHAALAAAAVTLALLSGIDHLAAGAQPTLVAHNAAALKV